MTLHISRKKAHRGTIKLGRNAFGNEHYLSFEVLHGRRNPACDGMADDTFSHALVFASASAAVVCKIRLMLYVHARSGKHVEQLGRA